MVVIKWLILDYYQMNETLPEVYRRDNTPFVPLIPGVSNLRFQGRKIQLSSDLLRDNKIVRLRCVVAVA